MANSISKFMTEIAILYLILPIFNSCIGIEKTGYHPKKENFQQIEITF